VVECDQIGDEGVPIWEGGGRVVESEAVGRGGEEDPSETEVTDVLVEERDAELVEVVSEEEEGVEKVPFDERVPPVDFQREGVESVVPFDVLEEDEGD